MEHNSPRLPFFELGQLQGKVELTNTNAIYLDIVYYLKVKFINTKIIKMVTKQKGNFCLVQLNIDTYLQIK